jgi:glycosyltransferase involved in cell wall biosynthesis
MKILLDDLSLRSLHSGRGIGSYTRLLAKELADLQDIDMILGDWKKNWKSTDLVHFPYLDLFSATLPLLRKPIVVTIHDVIPLQFPDQYPSGKRGKLALWRQKLALRSVQRVITVSQASKQSIHEHLQVPLSKIHVVLQAADPQMQPQTQINQEKARHAYALPERYILYVGDINYNKNLPQLIKSLKYIDSSIHLVLVGHNFKQQTIPEWTAITQQIALSDVGERIHFLPNVKTGESTSLACIYARSLCYVQPSLAEGFGLPVLDALQVGTPVIASNRTSLPEVGGAAAHYVEPTAEAFGQAVMEIVAYSPDKRKDVIKEGQAQAATFSWKKTAQATAQVYREVLRPSV